jgi:hypothetical protein
VIEQEPLAPRQLNARVPRDLETICLKCLQKEPSKRYPTAQALADDLTRWLEGVPIVARPAPPLVRAAGWCRRNPLLAALIAASVVVGALGGASLYFAGLAKSHALLADARKYDALVNDARQMATAQDRVDV